MARLTMAQRRALPKSAFAVPSKAPGPGSYPIPDRAHIAAAEGRAKQFGTKATQEAVRRKIHAKFPKVRVHKGFEAAMKANTGR